VENFKFLYVDLLENFKFSFKIYVWLGKLHSLATERLYHVTFLRNSTFLLCLYTLLLSKIKKR
jgi:hypothetical protein